MEELAEIKHNYQKVMAVIKETAVKCGRNPDEIKLIVVTKSQPIEKISVVVEAGARFLGENYPDETEKKLGEIENELPVEWHMIGHLQGRKIKIIADIFSCFQSLDRIETAQKLNELMEQKQKKIDILVEVNVSGEESKQGLEAYDKENWGGALEFFRQLALLPQLEIHGLMSIPPFFDDPEQSRPYFKKTKELLKFLQTSLPELKLDELSMGTSMDYRVAIEEGATFVRIGQAIMGARVKRN